MSTTITEQRLTGLTPAERAEVRGRVDRIVALKRSIAQAEGEIVRHTARVAAIAHAQGERSRSSRGPEYARRSMAAEIAAATRVHPATARSEMEQAEALAVGFPTTLETLERGDISRRHARVIADAGVPLDRGAKASLDAHASRLAQTRTAGETGRVARVAADDLAPRSLRARHRDARRDRTVAVADLDDGMSELRMVLPTFHAQAIHARLTEMARHIHEQRRAARRAYVDALGAAPEAGWGALYDEAQRGDLARAARTANDAARRGGAGRGAGAPDAADTEGSVGDAGSATGVGPAGGADSAGSAGEMFSSDGNDLALRASDTRTFDQLRADLAADLILSAAPTGHELGASGTAGALAGVTATVQVVIPAEMIVDPEAGQARGDRGALVSPDSALAAAAEAAGWDRLFVSPATGQVLATDRYRPTADQRRLLVARDEVCGFPGCTMPASRCDIDHTVEFSAGGATTIANLAHLCRAHHTMRHLSGWRIRQLGGGVLEWTSPTGAVYVDAPPRQKVAFVDDRPPTDPTPNDPWRGVAGLRARAELAAEARAERSERAASRSTSLAAREDEQRLESEEAEELRALETRLHSARLHSAHRYEERQPEERQPEERQPEEYQHVSSQEIAFSALDEICFAALLADASAGAPARGTVIDLYLAPVA